jgi:LuxR family maltose regulon positive regulatory protein
MVAGSPRAAATVPIALDQLLLDSKLTIPLPRAGFVQRVDLIESARTSDRPIVAITAPSGYGKSSLLSQWAAEEDRAVAWVALDRFDDDPVSLLALLASAFVRATGGDPALVAAMRGHGTTALGRATPHLASALRSSPQPFVMMLDDLQELSSTACHDVLSVIAGGIPLGSQLVSASRTEQPHVPHLRGSGDVAELGIDELALDADGARQIFAGANLELAPEAAATVIERTEGWPVGLYLTATISHERDDGVAEVSGDDRYVADYLYRESLAALPAAQQSFLRRTAVLDRFSAGLCDALIGGTGSQRMLRDLEASNVFLIPLDRNRGWYRYHSLYREFLIGELRRVEPEIVLDLHARAADWYQANGAPALALEHLLGTGERERCIRLMSRLMLPTFGSGEMATAQRWLTEIGEEWIIGSPPLAVLACWIAARSGHPEQASRLAAIIDTLTYDLPPADGTASFESGRAMLRSAMVTGGAKRAVTDAETGLAEEPEWSVWRDQALCLAGEARLLIGDIERADAYFTQATTAAIVSGTSDIQVLSDSERAMMAMDRGLWEDAGPLVARATASIAEHHLDDYATAVLAFAGAARLAQHRGDRAGANRELTRAMRARPTCTYAIPALAVRVRISLARTYLAMGDHGTARHLLHECEDILLRRPHLGRLVDELASLRERLASMAAGGAGASPLTPAELRLLPYLQTHLTVPEIAARLFVTRNTVSTEVGAIYRKLGVSSRSDAVERATAIGLLGS